MGNNDAAKIALKSVIDNSGKELVSFDEYEKMFNENQTKFNKESILEINLKMGIRELTFGTVKDLSMHCWLHYVLKIKQVL